MKRYKQNEGFNEKLNKYRGEQVIKYAKGKTCLEIGCGEGQITKLLVKSFKEVTVIDMDKQHIDAISENTHIISKYIGKFEDMLLSHRYDYIVVTNVLEHVDDVDMFLNLLRTVCHKKTRIFISVPNCASFNRILGFDIGMLKNVEQLGKHDKKVGHKRMFDIWQFEDNITDYFKIVKSGTMIYKPFPNNIMNTLPKEVINKCFNYKMENRGAEIYAICKLK